MKRESKRILIVDDDRDIVASMTLVLEAMGHQVDAVHTTDQALDRARDFDPELMVLDVMFPENPSAGFELARALRREPDFRRTPMLMLSAVNSRTHMAFSNKDRDDHWLPVDRFEEKPVAPNRLVELVDELTAGGGA